MGWREFQGNFGLLQLFEDESQTVHGHYGKAGTFEGSLKDGVYDCVWKNGAESGRLRFEVDGGLLSGAWKRGLDEGPMRGKWNGRVVIADGGWNILYDIGTFYVYFGNLATEAAQSAEIKFVNKEIRRWELTVEDQAIRFDALDGTTADAFFDVIYDKLYCDAAGEPNKNPAEQLNAAHANLFDLWNKGVIEDGNIRTLMLSLFQLCEINGFSAAQHQRLSWYVNQWLTVCPEVEAVADLLKMVQAHHELKQVIGLDIDLPWNNNLSEDDQNHGE